MVPGLDFFADLAMMALFFVVVRKAVGGEYIRLLSVHSNL
jgi:hypothetical protein